MDENNLDDITSLNNMNAFFNKNEKHKDYKATFILVGIIVVLLIALFVLASFKKKTIVKEVDRKLTLDEISIKLTDYIKEEKLDALDAYGMDGLERVAINKICTGVYECKKIYGSAVSDYIKDVFNKSINLTDINCNYNDGVLYSYDTNSGLFVWNDGHAAHPSLPTVPIYTKVNSIRKKDDKYILVLNKLYYNPSFSEYITSEPSSINQIYNANNYMHTTDNGEEIDLVKLKANYENDYDNLKNKGIKYRYTFGVKGNSYYLERYEVLDED